MSLFYTIRLCVRKALKPTLPLSTLLHKNTHERAIDLHSVHGAAAAAVAVCSYATTSTTSTTLLPLLEIASFRKEPRTDEGAAGRPSQPFYNRFCEVLL